jgi:predicted GNAT family N-acyltransferase
MSSPGQTSAATAQTRGAFARGFVRAELDQIRRRPFSMPSGWLVLGLTALIAIAILEAAANNPQGLGRLPLVLVYVLAHLAGFAGSVGLVALAQLLEALRFATARHAYLLRTAKGAGGAYVVRERGRLTLSSLWAWPRGTGIGAQVLQQACRDVEQTGTSLWLVASNRDLVRFYQQYGFMRTRRVLFGHLMLRHPVGSGEESVQERTGGDG